MSSIRVLLAEDELALGSIVKESLESRGFEVILCGDGQAAWECYLQAKPDVLVLDVMMPKKETLKRELEISTQCLGMLLSLGVQTQKRVLSFSMNPTHLKILRQDRQKSFSIIGSSFTLDTV